MFQRLLVPLDGSMRAEKAIPVAADLARAARGTITLARVLTFPAKESEYGIPAAQSTLFAEAKAYLDTLLDRYEQEFGGLHLVLEVISGSVPSSLFELSSQEHLDLIVMCSRGESGLRRWVLGSVAQATFRQSPLPVLVLNEHGESRSLFQSARPLRILVPLDGSALSEAAFPPVFQLLRAISPSATHEIHLVRVVAMPAVAGGLGGEAFITNTFQEEECKRAEQELQALAQRLEEARPKTVHCAITTAVVNSPDIAGTILRQAQPSAHGCEGPDCDLIALATHGRTGLKRLLAGSVTEQIFGATTLPLLVVRPSPAQFATTPENEKRTEPEQSWVGLL